MMKLNAGCDFTMVTRLFNKVYMLCFLPLYFFMFGIGHGLAQ